MDILKYLKLANSPTSSENSLPQFRISVVTNFTDDLLKKLLKGMCLAENIQPNIYGVPYGQYQFELKDPNSGLYAHQADVTFIFFDANPYLQAEFTADPGHAAEMIEDIRKYCSSAKGTIVTQTLALPARTPHGNLFQENPLHATAEKFNDQLWRLAEESKNIYVLDTNRILRFLGEKNSRDLRSMYAFRQPFTHEFAALLAKEWLAFIRALLGKVRKCIVVDLDNTLWGGVVGEVGPLGIALGQDYPGNAFQNFQRLLLEYYKRGIILAINSRNNPEDVREVFEKNKNMVLNENHFSAIYANWSTKAENLVSIAQDLNIGLDSLVFLDDDSMNRDMVRTQLPEVHVPDFSLAPEEYAQALLDLDVFHQLRLTDEDKERGKMYADERQRKTVLASTQNLEDYITQLGIEFDFSVNAQDIAARLAQLTQKTNQFNLTTRRYTEDEINGFMASGQVFAADVRDRFGDYGVTLEAIVLPKDASTAELDIFLMSCRVMGRGVEKEFLRAILEKLEQNGIRRLMASFIPTNKNMPAADFLASNGFTETSRQEDGTINYGLDIKACRKAGAATIKVNDLTQS